MNSILHTSSVGWTDMNVFNVPLDMGAVFIGEYWMDGCPWFFYRRFWDGFRDMDVDLDVQNYSIGGSGTDFGSGL